MLSNHNKTSESEKYEQLLSYVIPRYLPKAFHILAHPDLLQVN